MKPLAGYLFAVAPLFVGMAATGCGVHSDKIAAKTAIDSSSEKTRTEAIEASAQLLDEKPELVDELYRVVRTHQKTMERFLKDAAGDLEQKWLAKAAAEDIVDHPAAIEEGMGAAIVAIEKNPQARAATNKSLAAHSGQAVDIATDDPRAMAQVLKALLAVAEQKPAARKNMVLAIHEDRSAIIAFMKEDKDLSRAIAAEYLKEAVKDKPLLDKVLAALGAFDVSSELALKTAKTQGEAPITK